MNNLELLDNENIIDAAGEFNCPLQNKDYNEKYRKWRNSNKYGFSFVSDTSEIAYLDGVGFINEKPDSCERKSLKKLIFVIGVVLCIYYIIELFAKFGIVKIFNLIGYNIRYDFFVGIMSATATQSLIINGITEILKITIPLIIITSVLKLPKAVAFPTKIINHESAFMAVPVALMTCAIGFAATYCWGFMLSFFSLSLNLPDISTENNLPSIIISVAVYAIIVPTLTEILFRGIIMQSLRQFGDGFALIFTGLIAAMVCHDLSQIWYALLMSLCISYIAMCTGSILPAIATRIFLGLTNFVSVSLNEYLPVDIQQFIVSCTIILYIFVGFITFLFFSRKTESVLLFRFTKTYMKLDEKLSIALLSNTMLIWLVFTFVLITTSAKFVV